MDLLLELLNDIRPDVDFEEETGLIDDEILSEEDCETIVAEVNDQFGVGLDLSDETLRRMNSAADFMAYIEEELDK